MDPTIRPPNRSDGPTAVTATEERGAGEPLASRSITSSSSSSSSSTGSTGAGEPLSPVRCRGSSSADGLDVFQKRSIFVFHRSSSSGYFSSDCDSLPSSPRPLTGDRSTQTPSPSGQVMTHAWHRMEEAHGGGGGAGTQRHGRPRSLFSRRSAAEDMQAEAVGQELRRIGDDFNAHLILRRAVRRRAPAVLPVHPEPAVLLLCVSVLLLVIGRLIYLQGGTRLQDHSQV